jgi:hypothetical protein
MTDRIGRCVYAAPARYPETKPTWKMNAEQLARVWAKAYGWHTHHNGGGWIYDDREHPRVQGWGELARELEAWDVIRVGRGISWTVARRRFGETKR